MKRMIPFLLMISICAAMLSACSMSGKSPGQEQEEASEADQEPVRIGISFDSFVIERWLRDRDVFVATAQSLGAEVNVQNANGDVEEQISQIEYLIDKKMDVITIIAIDAASLVDVEIGKSTRLNSSHESESSMPSSA